MPDGPKRYQIFFAELKRRKVFKVAAVYGAVSFAVLQGADIAFPRIGLPDWTITWVVALVAVGGDVSTPVTDANPRRIIPAVAVRLETDHLLPPMNILVAPETQCP